MAIDFATIANTVGAFPNVVSQNATGPSATDGTPLLSEWLKDFFGFHQAAMDHAGFVAASGTNESASAGSEVLESIQRIAGHPGEFVPWMGTIAIPTGIRLLELTGQVLLIANYVDLDAAVYCGDANNPTAPAFFRTSDAGGTIRNIAGPYIVMPDPVGYFLRGLDTGATVDPDGAGRAVGDTQAAKVDDHTHTTLTDTTPSAMTSETIGYTAGGVNRLVFTASAGAPNLAARVSGVTVGTPETRPVNMACRWCIRY